MVHLVEKTLSGIVLRTFIRRSPRKVFESFRVIHDIDEPIDRWLFPETGEFITATYPLADVPKLGPIAVYTRVGEYCSLPVRC